MITNERLLFTIIFTILFKYGTSIKCHVCNSKQDATCLDPFNVSTTLQECEHGVRGTFNAKGKTLDVIEIIMQGLDATRTNNRDEGDSNVSKTPEDGGETTEAPVMVCQKIVVTVGNESITGRGCSPHLVDGMHPCDAVKLSAPERVAATSEISVRHCVTCPRDACNSSVQLIAALIFIFTFTSSAFIINTTKII